MKNQSVSMTCLPPVAGPKPRVVILGSFPGNESLKRKEYYGHPRNQFWRIMGDLFGAGPDRDYAERIAVLIDNGVSLWDSVKSCFRETSADSRIRNAVFNDIDDFLAEHATIRAIFFDGKAAGILFERGRRGRPVPKVPHITLPSTSPAHAAMRYEEKLEKWKVIREYV